MSDTEGRLIVLAHSFFSSVITRFRICFTLPDWSLNVFVWKTRLFPGGRKRSAHQQMPFVMQPDCHPVFFSLHLPLVGSFLWSVLRAVHHGSSFRPADVVQLLSGSIWLCWHWLCTSKVQMNSFMGENRVSTVIKLFLSLTYEDSMSAKALLWLKMLDKDHKETFDISLLYLCPLRSVSTESKCSFSIYCWAKFPLLFQSFPESSQLTRAPFSQEGWVDAENMEPDELSVSPVSVNRFILRYYKVFF